MVNTHIGELAIHAGGKDFIFRPFFCRVANLGTPKEIFQLFEDIQKPNVFGFKAALHVLNTFADEDPAEAIGFYVEGAIKKNGNCVVKYKKGLCPIQDIHVLGCQILKDAIIGRPTEFDKIKSQKSEKANEFNPAEFVAIGDARLGGRMWKDATHIELQLAIRAKNGPSKEEEAYMSESKLDTLYEMAGKEEVLYNGK